MNPNAKAFDPSAMGLGPKAIPSQANPSSSKTEHNAHHLQQQQYSAPGYNYLDTAQSYASNVSSFQHGAHTSHHAAQHIQYNANANQQPGHTGGMVTYPKKPLHTFLTHNGNIVSTYPVSRTPRHSRRMFSMDVECVATGTGHSARSPCSVVVVNYDLERVLTCYIKPDTPVLNYLTEITGVKEGDLDDGESLEAVVEKVRAILGPDAWLVGQSIDSDIKWMHLEKGRDYKDIIELSKEFTTFNPKYQNYSFFSLEHEALVLMGVDLSAKGYHDPAEDAQASMELFKRFCEYGDVETKELFGIAKENLIRVRTKPSMAKRNNYNMHGICMAAFYPPACVCDDETLVADDLKEKMMAQARDREQAKIKKQ